MNMKEFGPREGTAFLAPPSPPLDSPMVPIRAALTQLCQMRKKIQQDTISTNKEEVLNNS